MGTVEEDEWLRWKHRAVMCERRDGRDGMGGREGQEKEREKEL